MKQASRTITTTIAGAAVLMSIAIPAFAEGNFSSHISNGRVGFETRSWWDSDRDETSTTISHGSKCDAKSVSYELMHAYRFRPDIKLGTKTLSCSRTGTIGWGRQLKGDYHVTIRGIQGKSSVSVASFRVNY
ncbi:hypothetical protein TPCG7_01270 [Cutibacterium granulosum]|nr:hypothetical protein TPCG7_01270 [Cutibacterium granulosum]